MRYNILTQIIEAGDTIPLPAIQVNSAGDITASGNDGLTLAEGQYLVTFSTDALLVGAGILGAVLALDGTPVAYTATNLATSSDVKLSVTVILVVAEEQTLTVQNNTDGTISYDNSVLTVVKLA